VPGSGRRVSLPRIVDQQYAELARVRAGNRNQTRLPPFRQDGSGFDWDRVFAIHDEPFARLMIVKAECLRSAGVISEAHRAAVINRAKAVIERCQRQHATGSSRRTSRAFGTSASGLSCPTMNRLRYLITPMALGNMRELAVRALDVRCTVCRCK
jgi:hypothetical protein